MHQCWYIRELVDRIVGFQAPNYNSAPGLPDSEEGISDLCALARTCKALQEPALDLLWYRQSSLVPLLRCFPDDTWCMRTVEEGPYPAPRLLNSPPKAQFSLTETRPFRPEDWARVDFYAQRVRELWFHPNRARNGAHTIETQSVYDVLRALKGTSLLPNVRSIHLELSSPLTSLRLLLGIASPSLYQVDLVLKYVVGQHQTSMVEQVMQDLKALPGSCPSVQEFRLTASIRCVDLDAMPKILHAWRHLHSVVVEVPRGRGRLSAEVVRDQLQNRQFLYQLSRLPGLRFLTVSQQGFFDPLERHAVSLKTPIVFADLTGFAVQNLDDDLIHALLEDCSFPSLKSCRVDLTYAMFLGLPHLLRSRISSDNLRHLHIRMPIPVDRGKIGYTELHPLQYFSNLVTLVISSRSVSVELEDHQWEALICNWPHLCHLHIEDDLGPRSGSGVIRRPSFMALAHLIRYCPDLADVTLTICGDHATDIAKLSTLPVSERLTALHLRHSSFKDLVAPALCIARMLPGLVELTKSERLRAMVQTLETWSLLNHYKGCGIFVNSGPRFCIWCELPPWVKVSHKFPLQAVMVTIEPHCLVRSCVTLWSHSTDERYESVADSVSSVRIWHIAPVDECQ